MNEQMILEEGLTIVDEDDWMDGELDSMSQKSCGCNNGEMSEALSQQNTCQSEVLCSYSYYDEIAYLIKQIQVEKSNDDSDSALKELKRILTPYIKSSTNKFHLYSDEDDIIQETIINIWHYRFAIKNNKAGFSYIKRIVYSTIYTYLRHKKTLNGSIKPLSTCRNNNAYNDMSDEELFRIVNNQPDYDPRINVNRKVFRTIVDDLKDQERVIFILRAYGYKYKEIEEITHINLDTAKGVYRKTLKVIKKKLKEYEIKEEREFFL